MDKKRDVRPVPLGVRGKLITRTPFERTSGRLGEYVRDEGSGIQISGRIRANLEYFRSRNVRHTHCPVGLSGCFFPAASAVCDAGVSTYSAKQNWRSYAIPVLTTSAILNSTPAQLLIGYASRAFMRIFPFPASLFLSRFDLPLVP